MDELLAELKQEGWRAVKQPVKTQTRTAIESWLVATPNWKDIAAV